VDGPVYDAIPALPVKQKCYEEVFIPDPTPPTSSTFLSSQIEPCDNKEAKEESLSYYIAQNPMYVCDVKLSHHDICEVTHCHGEHQGQLGWWVKKE